MVTIKEQITQNLLEARKTGQQREASLLRTILGEFGRLPSKEVTDDQALKVLQKMEKNLKEVLEKGNDIARAEAKLELEILEHYLPAKMDVPDLVKLMGLFSDEQLSNMGAWMKIVKEHCADNNLTFDGADARIVYETFYD